MDLSDIQIKAAMAAGDIVIEPFDPACLGANSYDVHLSQHLACYAGAREGKARLDAREDNPIERWVIDDDEGYWLMPGVLYLGSTLEYTEQKKHKPDIDGKSSIGRLGISIHVTAGRGDVGFHNHWTLEITVIHPTRVYAFMPIGQIAYAEVGPIEQRYDQKPSAKYNGRDPLPQPSRMWKNFPPNLCKVCGATIRRGLVVCAGMSPCFKEQLARRAPLEEDFSSLLGRRG